MNDIRMHRRILDTLTGPVERRLLRWIAERLPGWVVPDMLTAVGVAGGFVILIGYSLTNLNPAFLWLASLGFIINWFGDSLDGTLARVRKIERPVYGFYIDHAIDAYNEIVIFLGLGLSPYVRFDLALLALVGYLLLSVLVFLRTIVKGEFTISYGRLGPTEVRMFAICANTFVFFIGNPRLSLFSIDLTVYDWAVAIITIAMLMIALLTTARQARILASVDRGALQEAAAASSKSERRTSQRRKNREARRAARAAARTAAAGSPYAEAGTALKGSNIHPSHPVKLDNTT